MLNVQNLAVAIHTQQGVVHAINQLTLQIHQGEVYGLLGESGCGKSMTALSIMQLLPPNARIATDSRVLLQRRDLLDLAEIQMRRIRGKDIAMIFQEPMSALNPVLTVAQQLQEVLLTHRLAHTNRSEQMIELLTQVGLPDARQWLTAYPHQLSGGMKQRVIIAMALAGQPELLIADEPTTALDVTIQAQILALLQRLQRERHMGMLFITHDLKVARQMANRVGVMYAGHLVEQATATDFFAKPLHPYSQQLFASLPDIAKRTQALNVIPGNVPSLMQTFVGCRFAPRCSRVMSVCHEIAPPWYTPQKQHQVRCHLYADSRQQMAVPAAATEQNPVAEKQSTAQPILQVEQLRVYFPIRKGLFKRTVGYVKAVDGIDLTLHRGETLALVGESGSGKTTTGRSILQLVKPTAGRIWYKGQFLQQLGGQQLRCLRQEMQIVMQDPFSAMNPRLLVEQIIEEGMLAHGLYRDKRQRQRRLMELLDQVGLPANSLQRYPHEFSGGQRQRIAIARALAVEPSLIICDEPTSALDVSVQAQILNLLTGLQQTLGLSYLFITHNLRVVGYLADRVAVMRAGRLVEVGATAQVLHQPQHAYTQELIEAIK
jgi:peptide/nickel transport system ATP-binding protein